MGVVEVGGASHGLRPGWGDAGRCAGLPVPEASRVTGSLRGADGGGTVIAARGLWPLSGAASGPGGGPQVVPCRGRMWSMFGPCCAPGPAEGSISALLGVHWWTFGGSICGSPVAPLGVRVDVARSLCRAVVCIFAACTCRLRIVSCAFPGRAYGGCVVHVARVSLARCRGAADEVARCRAQRGLGGGGAVVCASGCVARARVRACMVQLWRVIMAVIVVDMKTPRDLRGSRGV